MKTIETRYEHVVVNEDNVPFITGTTKKVVELALNHIAYGWSPEELHFQHPYLTLGQIYSALAYYWDHREELDMDIQRRTESVDRIQSNMRTSQRYFEIQVFANSIKAPNVFGEINSQNHLDRI